MARRNTGRSGCATVFVVMLLIGLVIEYWYVALAIIVIVGIVKGAQAKARRDKAIQVAYAAELAAHAARVHSLELANGIVQPTPQEVAWAADQAARAQFDDRVLRLTALWRQGVIGEAEYVRRKAQAKDKYLATVDPEGSP